MAFSLAMSWNDGEEKMHQLLHVPDQDNPTSSMLTPQASFMLQRAPLLAIGALDSQSRPWTTIWGGGPGFSQPLGSGIVGTRTTVDGTNDPVVQALVGGSEKGDVVRAEDGRPGEMIGGLAIDLITRKRVKIFGRMVAGSLGDVEAEDTGLEGVSGTQEQLQLVTRIEQSLGNCPKYLNQYDIRPAVIKSKLVSSSASLSPDAVVLIRKADMFFLSTSTSEDMDTNHRGGPQGFVRIISNDDCGAEIAYPEYSGNRLYQSLGNLQINPKIGVVFPDYGTGDVLYLTGTAEILVLSEAAALLPGSNLAVKIKVEEARYVKEGLPFRGERKIPSPYNPQVRLLASEGNIKSKIDNKIASKTATLIEKIKITPSVSRFEFRVSGGLKYEPGQWIALDFSREMNHGYSHMRDDDPKSLNDDFVRTFTISNTTESQTEEQPGFEITIREVGPVTRHLFKQKEGDQFSVPVLGVGGEFKITQSPLAVTPFIAGGVGITPLLGQISRLDISSSRFKLLWTLRVQDYNLALDTFGRYPGLAECSTVFLTGMSSAGSGSDDIVAGLVNVGASVKEGRLEKEDLATVEAGTWYVCAGKGLRKEVLGWLEGKGVLFEDFDY